MNLIVHCVSLVTLSTFVVRRIAVNKNTLRVPPSWSCSKIHLLGVPILAIIFISSILASIIHSQHSHVHCTVYTHTFIQTPKAMEIILKIIWKTKQREESTKCILLFSNIKANAKTLLKEKNNFIYTNETKWKWFNEIRQHHLQHQSKNKYIVIQTPKAREKFEKQNK